MGRPQMKTRVGGRLSCFISSNTHYMSRRISVPHVGVRVLEYMVVLAASFMRT